MRVLKWSVPIDGEWHEIGTGAVAMVGQQDDQDAVVVWTLEPDDDDPRLAVERSIGMSDHRRLARVYPTGESFPGQHLGSVNAPPFAWHVVGLLSRDAAGGEG